MVKEKKYVKVKSNESDSKEVYGKDDHWKIIKIEQTGDPKKRATTKRVFAIIFWLIAIVFAALLSRSWARKKPRRALRKSCKKWKTPTEIMILPLHKR